MAYSTGSDSNNKLLTFKLKTKNVDKPYFEVKSKVDGKWTVLPEKPTNVEGDLVKVEVTEEEYEGNVSDKVKLYLADDQRGETYLLDLYLTFTTRSLFNSLLSLEKFENVKIGVYNTKPNDQGKVYPAISLRQGDNRVDWKYSKDQLPKTHKVTINKKQQIDSSELDAFYVDKLKELADRVKGQPRAAQPERTNEVDNTSSNSVPEDDEIF